MPVTRLIVLVIFCAVSIVGRSAGDSTAQKVFAKVQPSVVVVRTEHGQGSGVVIGENEVATNCHVLEGAEEIIIAYAAAAGAAATEETAASLSHANFDGDVCLLSVPGLAGMTIASLRKAKTLTVGEEVFAVGAPQGYEYSISSGIVSQLRSLAGLPPLIQTDVAISPGSSGGGLFDAEGNLVGLTTESHREGQNLNFAVPSEWIGDARETPVSANAVKEGAFDFSFDFFAEAIELQDNEDWQGLLEHCERGVVTYAGNANFWFLLGYAYNKVERYEKAIAAYNLALPLDPDADTWNNLGVVYANIGRRYESAIETYEEALRGNFAPTRNIDARTWSMLEIDSQTDTGTNILRRLEDAKKAYLEAFLPEAYEGVLRIDPNLSPSINIARGWGHVFGAYRQAIKAYKRALQIDPEYTKAWYNLSIAYRKTLSDTKADAAHQQYMQLKLLHGE